MSEVEDGNWVREVYADDDEYLYNKIHLAYARRRAEVCIASGFLQPSEYDQFTDDEVNIWIEILNKRNK